MEAGLLSDLPQYMEPSSEYGGVPKIWVLYPKPLVFPFMINNFAWLWGTSIQVNLDSHVNPIRLPFQSLTRQPGA